MNWLVKRAPRHRHDVRAQRGRRSRVRARRRPPHGRGRGRREGHLPGAGRARSARPATPRRPASATTPSAAPGRAPAPRGPRHRPSRWSTRAVRRDARGAARRRGGRPARPGRRRSRPPAPCTSVGARHAGPRRHHDGADDAARLAPRATSCPAARASSSTAGPCPGRPTSEVLDAVRGRLGDGVAYELSFAEPAVHGNASAAEGRCWDVVSTLRRASTSAACRCRCCARVSPTPSTSAASSARRRSGSTPTSRRRPCVVEEGFHNRDERIHVDDIALVGGLPPRRCARAARLRSRQTQRVQEQPARELRLEPRRLRRHDLAAVGDGEQLVGRGREQREPHGERPGLHEPVDLAGAADAADERDPRVGARVARCPAAGASTRSCSTETSRRASASASSTRAGRATAVRHPSESRMPNECRVEGVTGAAAGSRSKCSPHRREERVLGETARGRAPPGCRPSRGRRRAGRPRRGTRRACPPRRRRCACTREAAALRWWPSAT